MRVRDMVKLVYLIMMATLPEHRLEGQQLSYSIRKGDTRERTLIVSSIPIGSEVPVL